MKGYHFQFISCVQGKFHVKDTFNSICSPLVCPVFFAGVSSIMATSQWWTNPNHLTQHSYNRTDFKPGHISFFLSIHLFPINVIYHLQSSWFGLFLKINKFGVYKIACEIYSILWDFWKREYKTSLLHMGIYLYIKIINYVFWALSLVLAA